MSLGKSLSWVMVVGGIAACNNSDYCSDRVGAIAILQDKFAPCLGDGGFDAGFSVSSCESVLNGGNCLDGDRTALAQVGNAGDGCANSLPICDPATPGNELGIYLEFFNCLADAGPPGASVTASCSAALDSVNAGY